MSEKVEMAKSEDEELMNAIEEFKKSTQIAPNMAQSWHNLGMVQSKVGRLREAMESFNRYVALVPNSEEAKKIRDEMIKMEYRLEQTEKFRHLSGVWVMPDGQAARVATEGGKLTVHVGQINFPGIVERWMWGEVKEEDASLADITLRPEPGFRALLKFPSAPLPHPPPLHRGTSGAISLPARN